MGRRFVKWAGLALVGSLWATGCSDDVSQIDPLDIPDDTETSTSTTGLTTSSTSSTTADPTTSSTTAEPTSSSSTGSTGTTDATTSDGSTGTTGSIIPVDPAYEPLRGELVNAGRQASSASYRMVFTLGQPSAKQSTHSSTNYSLQGGIVGANASEP